MFCLFFLSVALLVLWNSYNQILILCLEYSLSWIFTYILCRRNSLKQSLPTIHHSLSHVPYIIEKIQSPTSFITLNSYITERHEFWMMDAPILQYIQIQRNRLFIEIHVYAPCLYQNLLENDRTYHVWSKTLSQNVLFLALYLITKSLIILRMVH